MGQKNLISPIILVEGQYSNQDLKDLKEKHNIWRELDIYEDQLAELYEITHPQEKLEPDFQARQRAFVDQNKQKNGNWIYFPWSGQLIHMVCAEDFYALASNRNKNLITDSEQLKLRRFNVGVLGMSVGNGIALAMAYSGIGNTLKIADFDNVETCNLNRLRVSVHQIGSPKVEVAATQIYEANPYINLVGYQSGIKEDQLDEFFHGNQPLGVVFDEIDDFEMKIKLRIFARQAKVPVVMLTSLGDNILIDIERYDLNSKADLFNGLLGNVPEQILHEKSIGEREKIKYATQLVGANYIPTRALGSLLEINKTLVGRPQLFSTVTIGGGLAAFIVRQIASGADALAGRSFLSLNDLLKISEAENQQTRDQILASLQKATK